MFSDGKINIRGIFMIKIKSIRALVVAVILVLLPIYSILSVGQIFGFLIPDSIRLISTLIISSLLVFGSLKNKFKISFIISLSAIFLELFLLIIGREISNFTTEFFSTYLLSIFAYILAYILIFEPTTKPLLKPKNILIFIITLFIIQFLYSIFYFSNFGFYIFFSLPFTLSSVIWIAQTFTLSLVFIDKERNTMKSGKNPSFKMNFLFDPKNPVWLAILRIFVISTSILILISGIIASLFLSLESYYWTEDVGATLGLFFLYLTGTIITTTIVHILGMVSLNLLFNVQAIRMNLEQKNHN
jgi:hypothetical protein